MKSGGDSAKNEWAVVGLVLGVVVGVVEVLPALFKGIHLRKEQLTREELFYGIQNQIYDVFYPEDIDKKIKSKKAEIDLLCQKYEDTPIICLKMRDNLKKQIAYKNTCVEYLVEHRERLSVYAEYNSKKKETNRQLMDLSKWHFKKRKALCQYIDVCDKMMEESGNASNAMEAKIDEIEELENQLAEEYRCLEKSLQKEEGIDSPQNVKQIKLRQYVRVALLGIGLCIAVVGLGFLVIFLCGMQQAL